MMVGVLGGLVGFAGVRLWWKGLIILLALAVAISAVATAIVYGNRDIYHFNMSPQSFLWTVWHQLKLLAAGYAIGFGGHWALRRLSYRGLLSGEADGPRMGVRTFLFVRPVVFAVLFSAAIAAIGFPQANTNDPAELAKRFVEMVAASYAMFVLVALIQWKSAKPAPRSDPTL